MGNKKKYIITGILLLILAFVWMIVNDPSNAIKTMNMTVKIRTIIYMAIAFSILGIAERLFIKSGIVPKWIRYIIYGQWIVVPIVLIITIVGLL